MKLIPVDFIPPAKRAYCKLQNLIEEFMKSQSEIVKVDFELTEYKNSSSCYTSLKKAVERSGYGVKVFKREDKIYLAK